MSKYTPGPWSSADLSRPKEIGLSGQYDVGISLGFINTHDVERRNECQANVRLIAYAPDLLEKLQDIVTADESGDLCQELIDAAKDVIYQATGENP